MAGNTKVGVGRKGKSLKSAIEDGTRKSRLNVVKKPAEGNGGKENGGGEKQGKSDIVDKPARGIAGYSGGDFDAVAKERLISITDWIARRDCLHLFNVEYLERYAASQARYEQVENKINEIGLLVKNEIGKTETNPLMKYNLELLKQVNQMNLYIVTQVNHNSLEPYRETGGDPMESILTI